MQPSKVKTAISKFPLRLMPSVREEAEEFSQREGVSLNQFINVAVAEKVGHLRHQAWLASRPKPTPELIAKALQFLDREGSSKPDPGDELPEGYVSIRESEAYKRAARMDSSAE